MVIHQDKFLDLVHLVLTSTWYTINSISTALHPLNIWERFVDDVYSIFKHTHLENFFHHTNNRHQNIKFTEEKESNGELAFFDTLLKQNNRERSLFWYIGSLHILTNTYTTANTTKQVARKVLFPPCLIEHIPLSQIKMTYTKKTLELSKC